MKGKQWEAMKEVKGVLPALQERGIEQRRYWREGASSFIHKSWSRLWSEWCVQLPQLSVPPLLYQCWRGEKQKGGMEKGSRQPGLLWLINSPSQCFFSYWGLCWATQSPLPVQISLFHKAQLETHFLHIISATSWTLIYLFSEHLVGILLGLHGLA